MEIIDLNNNKEPANYNILKYIFLLLSFLLSLISTILLIIILFCNGYKEKWLGSAFHLFIVLLIGFALKNLFRPTSNNILRYLSVIGYYTIIISGCILFYIAIILFYIFNKSKKESIIFYAISIFVWILFQSFFIKAMKEFKEELEKESSQIEIEKNLKKLMIIPENK